MAKPHTTDGEYTNPEVRYERSDIEVGGVFRVGAVAVVLVAVLVGWALWFGVQLFAWQAPAKVTDLPPAKVDENVLPPEPRLEGLEDVRAGKWRWMPDRAAEYYRPQEKQLSAGGDGELPINEAINALAGKLTAEKKPPPEAFSVRLPSKAASGRADTGGQ